MLEVIKGYKEFKNIELRNYEKLFYDLAHHGQNPKTLFIGCSDSRVVPNIITNSKPGDLFVTRNIGNFVPPFKPDSDYHATASVIEYATEHLEVENIIVCGHSNCGAISSMFKEVKVTEKNIHTIKWLSLGEEAKKEALKLEPNAPLDVIKEDTTKISVVHQLKNLLTYPSVKERVDEKKLFLHGWYYDIESGKILCYSKDEERFVPISKKYATNQQ
jgi:carbonic anhydrase